MTRNRHIDRLRGFSILCVLWTHSLGLRGMTLDPGYYGVVMFFVISGFLITGNTLKRNLVLRHIDVKSFYVMRIAKIMPPLLLFMSTMIALNVLGIRKFSPADPTLLLHAAYSALTFQYNHFYFTANVPGLIPWSPLWSLSIEEVFYLTFPFICFLTLRTAALVSVMLALILCGPIARTDFGYAFDWFGCADLLSIGCLSAIFVKSFSDPDADRTALGRILRLAGSTMIAVIILMTSPRVHFQYIPTVLALATACFLVGSSLSTRIIATNRVWSVLETFGRLSYEIYLFHIAIIFLSRAGIKGFVAIFHFPQLIDDILRRIVLLVVIVAISQLIAKYFSNPLNEAIRKLYIKTRLQPERASTDLAPSFLANTESLRPEAAGVEFTNGGQLGVGDLLAARGYSASLTCPT